MIIIAFGHSLLSMSGFETLAQVYREIAYPKLKNLSITANIVCWYAVVCTGVITVFAGMIIPDDVAADYVDNLIGGLAMNLSGPYLLRLGFHVFVVVVGVLILSGAVNTSIIGANGVLNRVAEDGVLLPWFRKPHKRFGTTFRIINMIVPLQIATISCSRGDMTILAEAYAFGVVWSFFLKSLGVTGLRFQRTIRNTKFRSTSLSAAAKFPSAWGSPRWSGLGRHREPVHQADRHQVRHRVHRDSCSSSSRFPRRSTSAARDRGKEGLEQFNLDHQAQIDAGSLHARPGCVLVAVRDYRRMEHLKRVLEKTNLRRHDIVVMTVRPISTGAGEYDLSETRSSAITKKNCSVM